MHTELQAQGVKGARKRVARLMRELGRAARGPGHRTITTTSASQEHGWLRTCSSATRAADQPNTKWVADTTSIWTAKGWRVPGSRA